MNISKQGRGITANISKQEGVIAIGQLSMLKYVSTILKNAIY
jgi:hypothetical protein